MRSLAGNAMNVSSVGMVIAVCLGAVDFGARVDGGWWSDADCVEIESQQVCVFIVMGEMVATGRSEGF